MVFKGIFLWKLLRKQKEVIQSYWSKQAILPWAVRNWKTIWDDSSSTMKVNVIWGGVARLSKDKENVATYLTREVADPISSGKPVIELWETSNDLSIGSLRKTTLRRIKWALKIGKSIEIGRELENLLSYSSWKLGEFIMAYIQHSQQW